MKELAEIVEKYRDDRADDGGESWAYSTSSRNLLLIAKESYELGKSHAPEAATWSAADERSANLEGLCKAFADRVEKLAFDMEPPNPYTPQFVQLCQYVRGEIAKGSEPQRVLPKEG